VSLADKASEGEKLLILAAEAGANGNPTKQKEYLDKLVAAYPNDERAHFTLGGYYFGQQDYPKAIEHYKKATELNPKYSTAFNILGYAYRQNVDYANAEQAFKKYIELIPNDPNPYDSYGELLLKMGRFDDSIAQYRKALSIDSNFVNSHFAIAAALLYMGKPDEASAELQKMTEKARSDGERRTALFGQTVIDVDSGKMDKALADVDKQYALGEKINDTAAMTGDLQTKGTILLEMGKPAEAKELFDRLLKMTEGSNLSQEIKDNTKRFHHYNLAAVALSMKDYTTAKAEAEEFRKGAEASKNPAQVRQSHQLAGMIALAEKDYDKAIAELQQTGQQNPHNFYRLCQAYQGKGDNAKAKEFCTKAAGFNSLPLLNYAFIRTKAQKMAAEMKS
jgi:tetratricopeptide (TPR) repeat protein